MWSEALACSGAQLRSEIGVVVVDLSTIVARFHSQRHDSGVLLSICCDTLLRISSSFHGCTELWSSARF